LAGQDRDRLKRAQSFGFRKARVYSGLVRAGQHLSVLSFWCVGYLRRQCFD